jgi:hypothetical protein
MEKYIVQLIDMDLRPVCAKEVKTVDEATKIAERWALPGDIVKNWVAFGRWGMTSIYKQ